jgi:TrmH family RNA methyltransferase
LDWNSLAPLSAAKMTLLRKLKLRKHRREEGLFVAEGVRLVEEAERSGARLEWAVAAESDEPRALALIASLAAKTDLYRTDPKTLAGLLDTSSPQSVAAVCKMPGCSLDSLPLDERALIVISDNLRDPGNFGAVVRTAAAAGCAAVIAAGEGVDPWNPKAVRGSMGGVFRLPIIEAGSTGELAPFLKENEFVTYLADMAGADLFATEQFPSRCALIIGGEAEGAGATAGLEALPLSIPMAAGVESLNAAVAAGIMIYQISRRMGGRRAN